MDFLDRSSLFCQNKTVGPSKWRRRWQRERYLRDKILNLTMSCNSRYFYMSHLAEDGNVEQIVDGLKMEKEMICGKLHSIIRLFQMFQDEWLQAVGEVERDDDPDSLPSSDEDNEISRLENEKKRRRERYLRDNILI
jgi:hypothetical protein